MTSGGVCGTAHRYSLVSSRVIPSRLCTHVIVVTVTLAVSMQPCGDRFVVPLGTYNDAFVAAVNAVKALPMALSTEDARVAVFDVVTGRNASQLAIDLRWDAIDAATATSHLYAITAAVPPSLVVSINGGDVTETDVSPRNATRSQVCAETYGNRSQWQRLSSGCGFRCDVPLAGHQHLAVITQSTVSDSGEPMVLLFLQRRGASLACGVTDGTYASPVRVLDANPRSSAVPDPSVLKIRGSSSGTLEFVRGPSLATAFLFRTEDIMSQVVENSKQASAISVISQVRADNRADIWHR